MTTAAVSNTNASLVRGLQCRECGKSYDKAPVLSVGDENDAAHRRQAMRRVARERRHPFQQRVPAPEGGHRAKVPRRIVRDVDLGRHRPLAS